MSSKCAKMVSLLVIVSFIFYPLGGYSLPQGEQVVAGDATFDRSQTNTLNVNVGTDKMVANYQSFSIAQPEAVNFYQPSSSSVALNRVIGIDPSSILGTLTATGKIFLINPNGIVFGQGCVVDTAGLVASTLNIANEDFLAGRYTFYGAGGSVVNQGYITAPGGYVSLLGSTVENTGVIEAELGSIVLASGDAITLNLDPRGLISVVVDEATTQNLEAKEDAVKNTGTISADGGKVVLTAKALDGVFDRAINTEGIIEANALNSRNGEVILEANGAISSTGDMSAEGGKIKICTDDKLSLGGSYIANSILFDPEWVGQTGPLNLLGDTAFWSLGHIQVTDDITSTSGFLKFFADATDESNTYHDGVGDFIQDAGTTISGTEDIEITGVNIFINGTPSDKAVIETINDDADLDIQLKAGHGGRSGNLNITDAIIHAKAVGSGTSEIYLWADSETDDTGGNITITDSDITVEVVKLEGEGGDGDAYIEIWSDYDITIDPSFITASVADDGEAEVFIRAGGDDYSGELLLDNTDVTARVEDEGNATVHLVAGEYEETYGGDVDQEIHLSGDGTINIRNGSLILAFCANQAEQGDGARVTIEAQDITIDDSDVTAEFEGQGFAEIKISAGDYDFYHEYWEYQDKEFRGGTLDILGGSSILAAVGSSTGQWHDGAEVEIEAYDIDIENASSINAQSDADGTAWVEIAAGNYDDIESEGYENFWGGSLDILTGSSVLAQVAGSGEAEAEIFSGRTQEEVPACVTIDSSSVTARVEGEGEADVEIASGDYTYSYVPITDFEAEGFDEIETFDGGALSIINGSEILAFVGESGSAEVEIYGGGATRVEDTIDTLLVEEGITIDNSSVRAEVADAGEADVEIQSGNYYYQRGEYSSSDYEDEREDESLSWGFIDILGGSTVSAKVGSSGRAEVEVESGALKDGDMAGCVTIDSSSVTAEVGGSGEAYVRLQSGDFSSYSVDEDDWDLRYFFEEESMNFFGGELSIFNNSEVLASVAESGEAGIEMYAGITRIDNSDVTALVSGEEGYAGMRIWCAEYYFSYEFDNEDWLEGIEVSTEDEILTGGSLDVLNGSEVLANVEGSGKAEIEMFSGLTQEAPLLLCVTIDSSSVTSRVGGQGEASVYLRDGDYERHYSSSMDYDEDIFEESTTESLSGGILDVLGGSTVSALVERFVAEPTDEESDATVTMEAEEITVDNSSVTAQVIGTGDASVLLNAADSYFNEWHHEFESIEDDWDYRAEFESNEYAEGGTIDILNTSIVSATVNGSTGHENARIEVIAGDVEVNNSTLLAQMIGYGNATVELSAGDFNYHYEGEEYLNVPENFRDDHEAEGSYWETEDFYGCGLDILNNSSVSATVVRAPELEGDIFTEALIDLYAGEITVDNSDVAASFTGEGVSEVYVYATDFSHSYFSEEYEFYFDGEDFIEDHETLEDFLANTPGTIDIVNASNVTADATEDEAEVYLQIGSDDMVANVVVDVKNGILPGYVNIADSTVTADVSGQGRAAVVVYDEYGTIGLVEDIADMFDLDLEDLIEGAGGPIEGPITVSNSTISASVGVNAEDGDPTGVYMITDYNLDITNSTLSATGTKGVTGIALLSDDMTITNSSLYEHTSDLGTGVILLGASGDLSILGGSARATADDYRAFLLGASEGEIEATGLVSAEGGSGFGGLAFLADGDIYAGNVLASGGLDGLDYLRNYILWQTFGEIEVNVDAQYTYGSLALIGSLDGDIVLGDVSADAVIAAALGDNIYDVGDVAAQYLLLLAYGDIGTAPDADVEYPGSINTNVNILSAYSWGEGDIYINEANDIELGLYLPVSIVKDYGDTECNFEVGVSVAANDGIVHIVSGGDMLVNSIVAPRGGVFLQALGGGSIYAGHGWCPALYEQDVSYLSGLFSSFINGTFDLSIDPGDVASFLGEALMSVQETPWGAYLDYFSPIMVGFPELSPGPNVIAGGYSYFSTPYGGTIGVGRADAPEAKDPIMSGGVKGIVRPGVIADTGLFPSPDIDLTRYIPPGFVLYEDTYENCCPPLFDEPFYPEPNGDTFVLASIDGPYTEGPQQIWPEELADPEELTFENPLEVCIQVINSEDQSALPEWFVPEHEIIAGLTLEIGLPLIVPPPPPPDNTEGIAANAYSKNFRAYYEILNDHRVVYAEPAKPTEFFAYHPLTPADLTAFDGIVLDAEAYEFIAGMINLKKTISPYFGEEEEEEERRR